MAREKGEEGGGSAIKAHLPTHDALSAEALLSSRPEGLHRAPLDFLWELSEADPPHGQDLRDGQQEGLAEAVAAKRKEARKQGLAKQKSTDRAKRFGRAVLSSPPDWPCGGQLCYEEALEGQQHLSVTGVQLPETAQLENRLPLT